MNMQNGGFMISVNDKLFDGETVLLEGKEQLINPFISMYLFGRWIHYFTSINLRA